MRLTLMRFLPALAFLCVWLLAGPATGSLHGPAIRAALYLPRGGGRSAITAKGRSNIQQAFGVTTRIPSGGVAAVPSTSSSITRWVGDIFNALSIVLVGLLFYYYFQVFGRAGCNTDTLEGCNSKPFDKEWWRDGFCVNVKNEKKVFTSTHAVCFYIDLALTWVLKKLLTKYDSQIKGLGLQNEYLSPMIPLSTIIHGVGHFSISWLDKHPLPGGTGPPSITTYVVNFVIYAVLFGSLYLASSPKFEWLDPKDPKTKATILFVDALAIVLAILSAILMDTKPFFNIHASFTAVQTLTITYAALIQLFFYPKEQKGFAYASFAGIVTFTLNLVGWAIALSCTSPKVFGVNLQDLFGHIWFDGYLASSYIIFLFTALKFMKPPSPPLAIATPRRAGSTVQSKK